MKKQDPGLTYPDATPVEVPVKLRRVTLEGDRFKQLVQRFSLMQAERGNESLEEADDFHVGEDDDIDFVSRHELTEMQEEGDMSDATFQRKRERFVRRSEKRVQGDGAQSKPAAGEGDVGGTAAQLKPGAGEGVVGEGESGK